MTQRNGYAWVEVYDAIVYDQNPINSSIERRYVYKRQKSRQDDHPAGIFGMVRKREDQAVACVPGSECPLWIRRAK